MSSHKMSRLVTHEKDVQTIQLQSIYQLIKNKPAFNYEKFQRIDSKKSQRYTDLFDSTIFLNRLTSSVIEAASANIYSDNYFKFQNESNKQHMFNMHMVRKKPPARLEQIDEEVEKSRINFNKEKQKRKESQSVFSPIRLKANKPKGKNLTNKNKLINKNQKKQKEKSFEIDLNEEQENLEKLEHEAENEKQLKMIDDLENGGIIEDIDLTTDDWVNVNPTEITKRYDMLRRYATFKIGTLKTNYENLEATDKEKIEKLKKQYYDHKKLWETERLVLLNMKDMELNWDQERSDFLDQAELAYKLQVQAQDAAENAIKQLEEFITEDAKLDRENAENTIQILRERSRTYTSFSMGNKEEIDEEAEATIQNMKKMSTEKSEKIQVIIENFTIKFPNKSSMDKIIEYINFETSNKYTLILNHANNNSRPNTRNEKNSVQSQSPVRKHSSLKKESTNQNVKYNGERKSARAKSVNQDYENNETNNDLVEQVISKVLNDDETMLVELRNSVRSRNSLRSKHLAQLEASKEKLNEIKTLATQKLIGMDQDLPLNDDEFNRSHGLKRDTTSARVKVASEAVLNRVASSKTPKSSMNSSIINHPIVLEYIKTYDIVVNFKNLIQKNLPATDENSILKKIADRLISLKTIEYDQDMTLTPQIINMTSNVDTILSEIKIIFSELIDENVSLKYDLLEKEQHITTIKSRPNTSMNNRNDLELEALLKLKDEELNKKENELRQKEFDFQQSLAKLKQEYEQKQNGMKNLAHNRDSNIALDSPHQKNAPAPDLIHIDDELDENSYLNVKKISISNKKFNLKEAYASLEAKYESETKEFKKQIESLKSEIDEMSRKINSLKNVDGPKSESSLVLPPIKRKSIDSTKREKLEHFSKIRVIIFTKIDAFQNEKRLRNALIKGTITEFDYQNVKNLMDSYINLQENILVEMLKTYLNMERIKSIKENILTQNEDNINTDMFCDKMQKIHNKKRNRFMEKVQTFKEKRIGLANDLNDALVDIEQQSGIFLVKPFCSYKGLDPNLHFLRLNKLNRSISAKNNDNKEFKNDLQSHPSHFFYQRPALTDPNIFLPKILNQTNWNLEDSIVQKSALNGSKKAVKSASDIGIIIDTPKILEIDINRMMISQNKIAANVHSTDQLPTSVRSYLAFNRSTGSNKKENLQDSELHLRKFTSGSRNLNSPTLPSISPKKLSSETNEISKTPEGIEKISRSNTQM